MKQLTTESKLWLFDQKRPFKVRALSERFVVCTKPYNPQRTVVYTIIDLVDKVMGPENLIFGLGAETDNQCQEMLTRISRGETEISHRHRVPLIIDRILA